MRWLTNLTGTKQSAFRILRAILDASGLTASRTFTLPDSAGTFVIDTATQTLSNKKFDTDITPHTNNGAALGTSTVSWADLFLANGGVIQWANGALTLTHTSATDSLDLDNGDFRVSSPGSNSASVLTRAAIGVVGGVAAYDAALVALASGSDFVQLTGPTTSIKTFTLPNSNATLLYEGGTIGGTTPAAGTFTTLASTSLSINSKSLSLSGNTTIGSSTHTVAFATTGNTSVTLPTSGTLIAAGTSPTLSGVTINETSAGFSALIFLSPTAPSNGVYCGLDGADNFDFHQRESAKSANFRHNNVTMFSFNSSGLTFSGSSKFTKTLLLPRTDDGNSGTTKTIDWTASNYHKLTLTGSVTLTFTAPSESANLTLQIKQDATGSRTITWPSAVKWPGGTAQGPTSTANSIDFYDLAYDATDGFYRVTRRGAAFNG